MCTPIMIKYQLAVKWIGSHARIHNISVRVCFEWAHKIAPNTLDVSSGIRRSVENQTRLIKMQLMQSRHSNGPGQKSEKASRFSLMTFYCYCYYRLSGWPVCITTAYCAGPARLNRGNVKLDARQTHTQLRSLNFVRVQQKKIKRGNITTHVYVMQVPFVVAEYSQRR